MTTTEYRNFDLLITRAGDNYKAIVVDAPAGEASVLFDLPSASAELAGLGGLVRGLRRNIGVAEAPESQPAPSLTGLGSRLFEAIFRDKVGALLAASQASVSQEGAGLRLRLRFEEDAAQLALLPWETLYDPGQGHFVGLGEASPILRYLSLPRSRSALPVKPPLRVLALLSSPAQLPSLDVEREWQAIQDALAALVSDGKFVLERLPSPTLDALQQRLLGEPVHILHFIGHGVFDEAAQAGCLALEDGWGRSHLVQGGDLAKLLRNHPAVRLAYLNACEGALASGQSVFTGVAQALVREGVPAAVAMQAEISDPGAIELARIFYTALAAGRPVDAALTQARVALSAAGSPEWAIPVLFSRSPDNRLFDIRQVLPTPDCPYPGMAPFSEAQKEFFFGRDREIEEGVERLRQHPFLAIVGPSGSGKSSLIYAGVIPALRRSKRFGPGKWTVKIMRPGQHPLAALAERLGSSPGTLSSLALTERTLLFVDQFEEVFTLAGAEEAQAFLTALQGLIGRPNLHILLTARADFYPDLMACPLWQPIRANRLELPPLGDDELWAAIVEPANRVGVTVDEALAVKLIADAAGERGSLPLVQETLVLLWDRVEERQLALKAYQAMAEGGRSGLQVAIDRRASLVYDNLSEGAQPLARRIFLRLIQFGEGRADTRRQQTVDELRASGDDPALFDQTLAKLTESRLLTSSGEEGGARRVDIAHEALIAGWPRLQEWLNQRRAAEQTRRRLEGKAAEWVAAQQKGGLLDEYELQEAESWLAGEDAGELGYSQALADLVRVSKGAIAQAAAEKEAQQRRELEQAQHLAEEQRLRAEAELKRATEQTVTALRMRRRNRFLMAVGAVAVLAAILAGVLGIRAVKQQKIAEAQARRAHAGELAVYAQTELANMKDASGSLVLLLAREAVLTTWKPDGIGTANADATLRAAVAVAPPIRMILSRERHTGPVTSAAYSPDGKTIVTASEDDTARIWDAATGAALRTLAGHTNSVNSATYSPDGRFIVTASHDNTARIWDAATGAAVRTLAGHTGPVNSATYSPDGRFIVTASEDDTARIWNAASGAAVRTLVGPRSDVRSAAYSPDGKTIVTASSDFTARIWDAATGKTVHTLDHTGAVTLLLPTFVYSAAYSPDGRFIITASGDNTAHIWDAATGTAVRTLDVDNIRWAAYSPDRRFIVTASNTSTQIWDATTGAALRTLAGHTNSVNSATYSPDGRFIVTASRDNTARIWNSASGAAVHTLGSHTGSIHSAAYSPDGKFIVTASADQTARVWNTASGAAVRTLAVYTDDVNSATYSPDGRFIVTASEDKTTRIWDAGTGQEVLQITGPVTSAAYSSDGKFIVTAGEDDTARIWDAATGATVRTLTDDDGIRSAAYSPNSRFIVTAASRDYIARIWDAATGIALRTLAGHTEAVNSATYSPDGRFIVTASEDDTARIWDAATGKTVRTLAGHTGPVNSATYSPDGKTIVTASEDHTARIWDAATGATVRILAGHTNSVNSATYSPDGKTIVTASEDDTARIWDVATDAAVRTLASHTGPPISAAYSPDGKFIVTASEDKTARIWDAASGKELEGVSPLSGHTGPVTSAAYSPDGKTIVTASEDDTARIWDAATGAALRTLAGHTNSVNSATYSPDGRFIVTASHDNTARIWDAATGAAVRTLAGHTGPVNSATYSPDGKLIVTAGGISNLSSVINDTTARIWDAASGAAVSTLAGHTEAVLSAAYSPDGKFIVTASEDKTARIWIAVTGQEVRQLTGHTEAVLSAAYSPDGRFIVTASRDTTARIWDADTDVAVRILAGHTAAVNSVAYSPDGKFIITASADQTARIWIASMDDLLDEAARLIQRDPPLLTPEERQHYGLE